MDTILPQTCKLITLVCSKFKSYAAGASLCTNGESVSTHPGNQHGYHGNPITEQNTIIGMLLIQVLWSAPLYNNLVSFPQGSPAKKAVTLPSCRLVSIATAPMGVQSVTRTCRKRQTAEMVWKKKHTVREHQVLHREWQDKCMMIRMWVGGWI